MTIGTIIVSAGLLALSQVHDQASYFAVWAVLGVGMRCCLYDAAFAALVHVTPSRGRKAISYLTLYGAYASTVFWVIGHYLNEAYGWRGTLIAFAAINLAVCLPLNWIGLSRSEAKEDAAVASAAAASSDGAVLKDACASSASSFLRSSCRSIASSLASSFCRWFHCSRQRASPVRQPSGSPHSRAMASSPAGSLRSSSAATSRG
jgi:MFS family permease